MRIDQYFKKLNDENLLRSDPNLCARIGLKREKEVQIESQAKQTTNSHKESIKELDMNQLKNYTNSTIAADSLPNLGRTLSTRKSEDMTFKPLKTGYKPNKTARQKFNCRRFNIHQQIKSQEMMMQSNKMKRQQEMAKILGPGQATTSFQENIGLVKIPDKSFDNNMGSI